MAWFTYTDLQTTYSYAKVQTASSTFVNNVLIPRATDIVQKFVGEDWTDSTVPAHLKRVAKNIAVNLILADDENVKIAQARGQPSFTVAGDTVTLDLTPGRNPFISAEDLLILEEEAQLRAQTLHIDKVTVRSQGQIYEDAVGRTIDSPGDYTKGDLPWWARVRR